MAVRGWPRAFRSLLPSWLLAYSVIFALLVYSNVVYQAMTTSESSVGDCWVGDAKQCGKIVMAIEGQVPETGAAILVSNQSYLWDSNYCLYPRKFYRVESERGNGPLIREIAVEKNAGWVVRICGYDFSDVNVLRIEEIGGEFACSP